MDFKDIAKMVIDLAPALGGALAIPTGGASLAVGAAVKALGSVFGLTDTAKPEEIAAAIQADPEAAFKMKAAEQTFKAEMRRLDLEELKAGLGDVQGARNMNTENTKVTGKRDFNLYFLAYLYTLGFFISTGVMVYLAMQSKLPADMPQAVIFLLGNLFGCLTAGVTAILQFFFGSSKGSQEKTLLLSKAEPIKETPGDR
jgi:hypothetical protein